MDCSKCIFSETAVSSGGPYGGPQTGCSANRIEIFKKRGKAEYKDGSYHLKQFCNLYRTDKWKEQREPPYLEKANEEIKTSFGVIIDDDTSKPFSDLEKTVTSFSETNYEKEKIKIVLSTSNERRIEELVHLTHKSQETVKTELITHLHNIKPLKEKESFQKVVDCNFFVYARTGTKISPEEFSIVDDCINKDLKQFSLFKNKDGISYCPSKTVRSLYLNHNDYDLMLSELEVIAKQQGMYKDLA